MADLSRGEHIARAAELADAAYAYHADMQKAGETLAQDPGRLISPADAEMLNRIAAAQTATMHALATLSMAYAQIADVLGQQPAEEPVPLKPVPPTPWTKVSKSEWQRDDSLWVLSLDIIDPKAIMPRHGWLLFGPGRPGGQVMATRGTGEEHAKRCADEAIAKYQAGSR